jgi:hypothetical protein
VDDSDKDGLWTLIFDPPSFSLFLSLILPGFLGGPLLMLK